MEQTSYFTEEEAGKMHGSQFMSAAEKETVLKNWDLFLKNNLVQRYFTKALYLHLINHCSFIAHYNIAGFYDEYFTEGDKTIEFLAQFDIRKGCRSVESGDLHWFNDRDYADINLTMIDIAGKYFPGLVKAAEQKQMNSDVARAMSLLAKHGIYNQL